MTSEPAPGAQSRRQLHGDPTIPRLWIGPSGEVVVCEDGVGHAEVALGDPVAFGLEAVPPGDLRHPDGTVNFDYVIALAGEKGWARVSRDAGNGCDFVVGARSERAAFKAAGRVVALGHDVNGIGLEIQRIAGDWISTTNYALTERNLEAFLKTGAVRARGVRNSIPKLCDWEYEDDGPTGEAGLPSP